MKGGLLNPPNDHQLEGAQQGRQGFNEGGVIEPPEHSRPGLRLHDLRASMKGGLLNPPNQHLHGELLARRAGFNEGGVIEPPEPVTIESATWAGDKLQ